MAQPIAALFGDGSCCGRRTASNQSGRFYDELPPPSG
jgi:hypothetical protein